MVFRAVNKVCSSISDTVQNNRDISSAASKNPFRFRPITPLKSLSGPSSFSRVST